MFRLFQEDLTLPEARRSPTRTEVRAVGCGTAVTVMLQTAAVIPADREAIRRAVTPVDINTGMAVGMAAV